MEQVFLFAEFDLEFVLQVFEQFLRVAFDDLGDAHHRRAALADYRQVDRDRHRAVGVHEERLPGLLRVVAAGRHDFDFDLLGGVVVDAGDFDLVLFGRLLDRGDQALGGGGGRNFADDQLAAVDVDLRPEGDLAVAVLVFADIHHPALLEIGVELEGLAAQLADLGVEKFVEVVRHDAGGHAHRDAVAAQHQQRGNLHRQHHRLLAAPVVGVDEFGDVVVEQHLAPHRRQAAFDVTRRGGGTAGQRVAEVPLLGDEVFLVGQHHQRVADRGVAVRMKVHGVADHVGCLVGAPVVDFVERPEDAALDRLQTVVDVGDGAVLDYVAGVFEKVAVHHGAEVFVGAALADRRDRRLVRNLFRIERFRLDVLRFVTHISALPGSS